MTLPGSPFLKIGISAAYFHYVWKARLINDSLKISARTLDIAVRDIGSISDDILSMPVEAVPNREAIDDSTSELVIFVNEKSV